MSEKEPPTPTWVYFLVVLVVMDILEALVIVAQLLEHR